MAVKHYYAYPKSVNGRFCALQLTKGTNLVEFFRETGLNLEYTEVTNGVIILENGSQIEFNYGDWFLFHHQDFLIFDNEDFVRLFRAEELPNV